MARCLVYHTSSRHVSFHIKRRKRSAGLPIHVEVNAWRVGGERESEQYRKSQRESTRTTSRRRAMRSLVGHVVCLPRHRGSRQRRHREPRYDHGRRRCDAQAGREVPGNHSRNDQPQERVGPSQAALFDIGVPQASSIAWRRSASSASAKRARRF